MSTAKAKKRLHNAKIDEEEKVERAQLIDSLDDETCLVNCYNLLDRVVTDEENITQSVKTQLELYLEDNPAIIRTILKMTYGKAKQQIARWIQQNAQASSANNIVAQNRQTYGFFS
jgi:adenylosuccinate lyase